MACEHPQKFCTDSRFKYGRRFRNYTCPDCGLRFSTAEVILYQHDTRGGSAYKPQFDAARKRLELIESLTDAQITAIFDFIAALK